jgi:hypothetical protein
MLSANFALTSLPIKKFKGTVAPGHVKKKIYTKKMGKTIKFHTTNNTSPANGFTAVLYSSRLSVG